MKKFIKNKRELEKCEVGKLMLFVHKKAVRQTFPCFLLKYFFSKNVYTHIYKIAYIHVCNEDTHMNGKFVHTFRLTL